VDANLTTKINVGSIRDAEGDKILIKSFLVDNIDFRPFVKLVEQTNFVNPELLFEVNPPVSLIGNQTSILVVLADLNPYNP